MVDQQQAGTCVRTSQPPATQQEASALATTEGRNLYNHTTDYFVSRDQRRRLQLASAMLIRQMLQGKGVCYMLQAVPDLWRADRQSPQEASLWEMACRVLWCMC